MRFKIQKTFHCDVNKLYQLWTNYNEFLIWAKLPAWLEVVEWKDESGKVIGSITRKLVEGNWITFKAKTVFEEENVEIRSVIMDIEDHEGNSLFDEPHISIKSLAARALFNPKEESDTELLLEYDIQAKGILHVWDMLFRIAEIKKEAKFIFNLLEEYIE